MSKTNASVLEAANAAITKGDYEGFLVYCTDDTEWTFVGERTLKGKEAVRQWMATAYKEPPTFDLQRTVAEDDTVVALGEITTEDDDGKPVRNAYCDVWRFRDGKMAGLQAFVIPK